MRLHIGSGPHYADGWLNVDCDPQWRVDVVAFAEDLPGMYPAGTFTQVYMGHFLEHLEYDSIPGVVAAVLECCTEDVRIAVVGPCYDLAIATGHTEMLGAIRAGSWAGPGEHAWTATADLTERALLNSGLAVRQVDVTEIVKPEWPNPSTVEWQCAFLAGRG